MLKNIYAIRFHRTVFPLLKFVFRLKRVHTFINLAPRPETDGNVIFAVNHSCKYDIPYVCELIGEHSYVLVGKQPLAPIDRQAFNLNGTVWVDRRDREDKKRATARMISLLSDGANMIIFPEGTWNLTPSKPMLPLYWGIIDIAKRAKKPIVPVILEYTKDRCYVAFGEPMTVSEQDDKEAKINELADAMATLKWTIWKSCSDTGCADSAEWEAEANRRVAAYPLLDYEYEQSVVRKVCEPNAQTFAHLAALRPCAATAFLFNKRNHN